MYGRCQEKDSAMSAISNASSTKIANLIEHRKLPFLISFIHDDH